jgi:acyl carrier protein
MTSRRDSHEQKHCEQRIETQFGIQIDESDEQPEKTSDSIRDSFDGVSNMTSRRDLHDLKQFIQRLSTKFGIQIDESDEHSEKTYDSIR